MEAFGGNGGSIGAVIAEAVAAERIAKVMTKPPMMPNVRVRIDLTP
jgi:hypothetical protein